MSDTNKEAQEVLEEHKLAQPIDGEIEVIPQNGDETEAVEESIEEGLPVPPVTIHILAPGHARTLPKSLGPQPTLTLLPQPHETIQELKLAVNECLAGYWLGPYSLRIPAGKGKKGGEKVKPKQAAERESAVIGEGDRLSEWLEVGDVFAGFDDKEERVLEVVREPYTDFSARQTVLRLLELISPVGSSTHTLANPIALDPGASIFEAVRDGTATEPTYQEVEVALAGKKSKGKKEVVKVKKEAAHAFADWTDVWPEAELGRLPVTQGPIEAQSCLKNIQISPFNPPAPHLRQKGHQLYLQVSTLEGETSTLICASRGWYVSRSNVNTFDPTPRSETASLYSHSLIDLLHSISPLFTERLSQLSPLSGTAPALEPITTVPIPQAEPAYPFLTTPPKPASVADVVRSQLAYIHTGALSPDGLDGARDWNEEIQGIKELPKESMQERVFREKLGQKTWSEFTAASVRCVLAVARGDVPPLNPNEDARAHMFLASNIFITKAVDSIAAYSHVGGDAAAHVSHAKDAAGVKLLNKLDIDGAHLLGHTVVDWAGERWVCQSMLPGIFSRSRVEEDVEEETKPQADDIAKEDGEAKKEDWVEVNGSPTKSVGKADEEEKTATEKVDNGVEEIPENPLIIYGLDSEHLTSIHWDAATHKVMAKIATAQRLAAHKMKDGKGQDFEFYASNEVKGLRGTDGRRYLLDLPRMSPVDVEWLQKDIDGKLVGSEETGPQYPHRIVLLRPELVEAFWESELKRWAREVAAKKAQGAAVEGKPKEDVETSPAKEEEDVSEETAALGDDASPAATAAAVQRAEADAPLDTTLDPSSLASFNLRLNPDAFVDLTPAKGADPTVFVPSTITDESDPTIKAVRDASVFLRTVAIPAVVLDVLTGNTSGIMDGASLSKHLHGRGINIRYLGYLASTIDSFAAGPDGEKRESGHLAALKGVVVQEMIFRSAKHVLKSFLVGLQPEHIPCAVSHFLNCLLGTSRNASPEAIYSPIDLGGVEVEPAYVKATPESIRKTIVDGVKTRFRWTLVDNDLELGLRKKQLLRELAMRVGFQLLQKSYRFDSATAEQVVSDDDKVNKVSGGKDKKDKKTKKRRNEEVTVSNTTFQPSDILSLIPIVRSTAPSCSVAEEIFDAGRATINRGSIDLGLEFLLEAVQLYENIHSVIHPEVAAAYNQYSSTIHQLARLKMQQMATENADPEQPLGLDVATALRLQRQAVIIAERTLGVYHPETSAYYFNLAMLENLEGNGQSSLKYFRHVISLWDVIHGPGHPEINTVLSNAGVVLQTLSEHSLSLSLLLSASKSTSELFGPEHIQTAQSLHQLTQAHFLAGDILAALVASEQSLVIFEKRLGAEHGTTKEVLKNVLLLRAVVENERQKAAGAQAREKQLERLQATQVRVGGPSSRRRIVGDLPTAGSSSRSALGSAASAQTNGDALADAAVDSRIGKRGHLDVDELVKFIQGGPSEGSPRGKNTLRGKRRTGAKR